MKPAAVAVCIFLTVLTLSGIAILSRGVPRMPVAPPKPVADESIGPKVVEGGPQPKIVLAEDTFDFGTLEVGDEGSHVFTIRNEGEGVLELFADPKESTCSCTIGNVAGDGKVQPGGQTEVTLNWKIKFASPEFRHHALVRTNDPQNRKIELAVTGKVENGVQLKPEGEWNIGALKIDAPTEVTGTLYSPTTDKLEITEVKTDLPTTKITWVPLDEEQLKERNAKSGYLVKATIGGDVPVGNYSDHVVLKTNMEKQPEVSFQVRGNRPGPIDIMGRGWANEATALIMGDIPAAEGRTTELSFFVREMEGDLELQSYETTHKAVEVSLRKDEKYNGKGVQRYFLTVKVLPGLPIDRQFKNSEKVILKLNHPKFSELKFFVSYLALDNV